MIVYLSMREGNLKCKKCWVCHAVFDAPNWRYLKGEKLFSPFDFPFISSLHGLDPFIYSSPFSYYVFTITSVLSWVLFYPLLNWWEFISCFYLFVIFKINLQGCGLILFACACAHASVFPFSSIVSLI